MSCANSKRVTNPALKEFSRFVSSSTKYVFTDKDQVMENISSCHCAKSALPTITPSASIHLSAVNISYTQNPYGEISPLQETPGSATGQGGFDYTCCFPRI